MWISICYLGIEAETENAIGEKVETVTLMIMFSVIRNQSGCRSFTRRPPLIINHPSP